MDFSTLHHHALRAELPNVLDLQLVDVMSRFARGETWETQRRRLRSFLKTDELHTRPLLHTQVHRLSNLDGCIAKHAARDRSGNRSRRKASSGPNLHLRVRSLIRI